MQHQAYTGGDPGLAERLQNIKFSQDESNMFGLGWPEVAVIAAVGILIFGPKKIPEFGSALGKTLRGFKDEMENPSPDENEVEESDRP
nr:twin-arginine translocase TatA/TatE family subunit [Spirulina major]